MANIKSCPLRGKEMEKGYIVTVYDPENKSPVMWRRLEEVNKPRRISGTLDAFKYSYQCRLNDLEAYKCNNCKIAVLSYY